jgi:hypothetical protein
VVNGTVALRDGKVTGGQGGRVLARTAHMPSRPMTTRVARQVSAPGGVRLTTDSGEMRLTLDVTQTSAAAHARGFFGLSDPTSGRSIDATEFGVLQTTGKWASFTARVRGASGTEEQSAFVIIEQADSFVDGQPATVTVVVDAAPYATGRLSPTAVQIRTAQPASGARRRE